MTKTTSGENGESLRLWRLSKEQFNAWRRANDLPLLFAYFKNMLPHFDEWLTANNLSDTDCLSVDHTSDLFIGEGLKHVVDCTEGSSGAVRNVQVWDRPGEEVAADLRERMPHLPVAITIHSSKPFRPYFDWLHKTKRVRFFKLKDNLNNQFVDDLGYLLRESYDDFTFSRACLYYSHKVLKLGGATIPAEELDDRNLDFVDLDGLVVSGSLGTRTTSIGYSACHGITFTAAEKAFITFRRCAVSEMTIENSRIQDLHFVQCQVPRLAIRDSQVFRSSFRDSTMAAAQIENAELGPDFVFQPPKRADYASLADTYKRLRVAFQHKGERQEASAYYYRERCAELVADTFPLLPNRPGLPRKRYTGAWSDLWVRFRAGQHTKSQLFWFLRGNLLAYFKLLLPKSLLCFLMLKARAVAGFIDYAIWGFGERPARVFPWMMAVLLAFGVKYFYLGGDGGHLRGDAWESLYCSAFNFATMGCNYKTSFDSVEGLLGATLLGIMVAGFANRTRY